MHIDERGRPLMVSATYNVQKPALREPSLSGSVGGTTSKCSRKNGIDSKGYSAMMLQRCDLSLQEGILV